MKSSYYNIVASITGGKVLYNTMYKNIVELSLDEYKLLLKMERSGFAVSSEEESKLLKFLTEQMFIVDDNLDELEYFKLEWNRSLYSSGVLNHTILPNLACNLDCPYCFESKTGRFMSREDEENYLAWLEPQLVGTKYLYLSWFGGEPLLSKNTIERITEGILRMEKQYGFEYAANIVTNGVLLDKKFTQRVETLRIKSVQVTLDGDRDIHDSYRFAKKSGAGTFDTILENMTGFCRDDASDAVLSIRVNVTDENYGSLPALFERIPTVIKDKSVLMFRWVYSHSNGRNPGKEFSEKMKGESPITNLIPLYQLAEEMGFTTNSFDEELTYNFCECDFDKAFLIDQDGDLFMCSHSMEKEESVGNVSSGFSSQRNFSRYARFVNTTPFEDEECLECKILPLCKGGCRKARYLGTKVCSDVRWDIPGYILQKHQKAQLFL